MTTAFRPTLKEVFLDRLYRPNVYFYTSNIDKYLQARTIFSQYGLTLKHFRRTEPYSEDYSGDKKRLLRHAIEEIRGTLGAASLFFIEDTSLRIDALSSSADDVPGMQVKEWFQNISFDELDALLKQGGNNRGAIVKSGIALYIPGLDRPVYFTAETAGCVATSAPSFERSIRYPWLTPHSFNGWFIPEGASRRLGEMSFEESLPYDFRAKAIIYLIERLEEYTSILNLPSSTYSRKADLRAPEQLPLMPRPSTAIIAIGPTCAGKSTLGEYRSNKRGIVHIEASSIVGMLREKQGLPDLSKSDFARKLLGEQGLDFIARTIIRSYGGELDRGFTVTGFRTLEELEFFLEYFPDVQVVLIEATERTRFQRNLDRGRAGYAVNFSEFQQLDYEQRQFGLLGVAKDIADARIVNEGSLYDFFKQIDAYEVSNGDGTPGIVSNVSGKRLAASNPLYRCLDALEGAGTALNCRQIEMLTKERSRVVHSRDANRILKQFPELSQRIQPPTTSIRYLITASGRTYLRLVQRLGARSADPTTLP